MPMSLAAENETCVNMKLSPEEVVLNRGKEFEISLDMEESADIWGIFASIGYDPEALDSSDIHMAVYSRKASLQCRRTWQKNLTGCLPLWTGPEQSWLTEFCGTEIQGKGGRAGTRNGNIIEKLEIVGEKEAYTAKKAAMCVCQWITLPRLSAALKTAKLILGIRR